MGCVHQAIDLFIVEFIKGLVTLLSIRVLIFLLTFIYWLISACFAPISYAIIWLILNFFGCQNIYVIKVVFSFDLLDNL